MILKNTTYENIGDDFLIEEGFNVHWLSRNIGTVVGIQKTKNGMTLEVKSKNLLRYKD